MSENRCASCSQHERIEQLLALIRQIADAPARQTLLNHATGEWAVSLLLEPELYGEVRALASGKLARIPATEPNDG